MSDATRARVYFGALAIVISAALFGLFWALEQTSWSYNPLLGEFVVPAAAVMLAAQGFGWRRKVTFAAVTLLGFILVDWLAWMSGIRDALTQPVNFSVDFTRSTISQAYAAFVVAYPIIALVLFVGREPSRLWTPRDVSPATKPKTQSAATRAKGADRGPSRG